MNGISVLGGKLQRYNSVNTSKFIPGLRVKRLIKSLQLFKAEERNSKRYPIRAGYVAQRIVKTRKQFNQAMIETYPNNLLHIVSGDIIAVKTERKPNQDFVEALLSVEGEDVKNIPIVNANIGRFNKFLDILKRTYINYM